ncbi:hypothetical protein HYU15_01750 [Candidatus Woesearchaeota archaeon]|nr:hypothetical protein [Candidatus Woesearchaeota archaeon]
MKATYSFGSSSISNEVAGSCSFFLANGKGSFLHFANRPVSKYNGWFFYNSGSMFRIIEDIQPVNCPQPSEIASRLYCVDRKRAKLVERFFIPHARNSFAYELSEPYLLSIALDIRKAYDMRQWGRSYEIKLSDGLAVIRFTKSTHILEDLGHGAKEYELFLAIRHDGKASCEEKWVYRSYAYDKARNSLPDTRYVFSALRAVAKRLVFSVAADRESAVREANYAYNNHAKLLNGQKSRCRAFAGRDFAYSCASKSLDGLYVANGANGLFAGLPWFFQFWSRDEAISSRALMLAGKADFAKAILFRQLKSVLSDGRTPNVSGSGYHDSIGTAPSSSADGIGWVGVRIRDLLQMKKLVNSEKKFVASALEKAAANLRKSHEKDGLIHNSGLETWMDTSVSNDTREGFRIEIQTLQLAIYGLLYKLTRKPEYIELEKKMAAKVREKFWNGRILADGLDDFTPRPNAFIAAYAYPQLLSKEEWTLCFRNLLSSLWLEWGGIATIDKKSPLFRPEYTGEPPYSYHRGDSWFWINNLAAIAMHRTDKKRFNGYIRKIHEASTADILWKGALGSHSELSSAKEQRAEGSLNQAWSNAMYVELEHELKSS